MPRRKWSIGGVPLVPAPVAVWPASGLPPCGGGRKLVWKSRGAVPRKSRLRALASGLPVGRPLPSSTLADVGVADVGVGAALCGRGRPARCCRASASRSAVQMPPGQSSIQPFGLAVAFIAACMLTMVGGDLGELRADAGRLPHSVSRARGCRRA